MVEGHLDDAGKLTGKPERERLWGVGEQGDDPPTLVEAEAAQEPRSTVDERLEVDGRGQLSRHPSPVAPELARILFPACESCDQP